MGFVKVEDLLGGVAKRSGDPELLEAAYVIQMVNKVILEVFGEKAIGNVEAVAYKKGKLTLNVASSVWGDYVSLNQKYFLDFFNKEYSVRIGTIKIFAKSK